jgi:hypothetical protein
MAVNTQFRLAEKEERATRAIATGTGFEAIGAVAGIVLSILALVGILPVMLAAVALIVLGVSVFFESVAVGANAKLISQESLAGGLSLSALTAVGVVALGILALLGILPAVLIPVGVIAIGACGILSSGEMDRLGHYSPIEMTQEEQAAGKVVYSAAPASAGLELIAGIATVILGILALLGIHPAIMMLTGLLVMSAGMFLSSAAITGRMAKFLTH